MIIENVKVSDLIPYIRNNKEHDKEQVKMIANSIKEYGFNQPLCIDKNNVVVVGHGRLLAAKELWLEDVPCVRMEDLTEEQINKYRILDNKLNESGWNIDNLKEELDDLGWDLSFGDLDISASDLFWDIFWDDEKEVREDKVPEVDL